jgi:hypothetical protein
MARQHASWTSSRDRKGVRTFPHNFQKLMKTAWGHLRLAGYFPACRVLLYKRSYWWATVASALGQIQTRAVRKRRLLILWAHAHRDERAVGRARREPAGYRALAEEVRRPPRCPAIRRNQHFANIALKDAGLQRAIVPDDPGLGAYAGRAGRPLQPLRVGRAGRPLRTWISLQAGRARRTGIASGALGGLAATCDNEGEGKN